jgi:hypothetical protein
MTSRTGKLIGVGQVWAVVLCRASTGEQESARPQRRRCSSLVVGAPILTDGELRRVVSVHDAPEERYTADGLFSHVMFHEIRHTAPICLLLRMQGATPPSLDLLFYWPRM